MRTTRQKIFLIAGIIVAIFGAYVAFITIPKLVELNEINNELNKLRESELQKSLYLFNFIPF